MKKFSFVKQSPTTHSHVQVRRGARYNAGVEGMAQLLDEQGSVDVDRWLGAGEYLRGLYPQILVAQTPGDVRS